MIEYIIFGMAVGGIPAFILAWLLKSNLEMKRRLDGKDKK